MLRRAAVPFKSTNGFHPTPRLVFALSLPLGVVGFDDLVELELTEPRDGTELLAALNAQAPAGLAFTRVAVVPMKTTAHVRRVVYELPLPPDRVPDVERACSALLAEPKVWVERLKPSAKRLNIRPYIRGLTLVEPTPLSKEPSHPTPLPEGKGEKNQLRAAHGDGSSVPFSPLPFREGGPGGAGFCLQMDLWVTQEGTARADELLDRLGISDLIDDGAVLERTTVEIRDEITPTDPADVPPDGPSDSVPLSGAEVAALTARLDEEANQQAAAVGWGASPNGPVVE
jgi:hypothetical protein